MSGHLVATIAMYAAMLATWAGGAALLDRPRGPVHAGGLALLELVLVGQAIADVLAQLGGHRPAQGAVHGGYLAASVLILPVVAGGALADDGSRWDGATLCVACAATAVVALRLHATWPAHGG